jgi:succinylarginine dihydrolase
MFKVPGSIQKENPLTETKNIVKVSEEIIPKYNFEEYVIAHVRFKDTVKRYTYKSRYLVKKGDYVVVIAEEKPAIAKVLEVEDKLGAELDPKIEFKWIVQILDLTEHNRFMMEYRSRIS